MLFEIAGEDIGDPTEAVAQFIERHEREIREYDLTEPPGGPEGLTARDILLTRYSRVRIDSDDLQFFIDRGRDAPWDLVPEDADLVDADPNEEDGLYDAAEALYMHFFSGRRRDITPAKIHRVVHMKRRRLYPLLDGRIEDLYEAAARGASKEVEGRRGRHGRLYWAAIRLDIIRNAEALSELRERLRSRDEPAAIGAQLTDVRLHDMVCWSVAAPGR